MKTNDIFICSFPKSGVTYLSFLLASARLRHNKIHVLPTFFNIDSLIIDVSKMNNIPAASIWSDGAGDFFKSHDPHFQVPNVIYLLRNPVDTLKSYYTFRKRLGSPMTAEEFIVSPDGIMGWINHVNGWLIANGSASQSIVVLQYEDLLKNTLAELQTVLGVIGLPISQSDLECAIDYSGLTNMRLIEDRYAARNPVYNRFNLEFVRKDDVRLVDEFTPEIIAFIEMHASPVYAAVKARLS